MMFLAHVETRRAPIESQESASTHQHLALVAWVLTAHVGGGVRNVSVQKNVSMRSTCVKQDNQRSKL